MQPFVDYIQEPKKISTTKLWHIATFDFGIPTGDTCVWKTKWCRKLCYGPACSGARFPATRPGWLQRLRLIENAPPDVFYYHIMAYAAQGIPLRFGRFGDASRPEVVEAIIKALKKVDVPFMWPTRAWLEPTHDSWQLMDRHLRGEVICSMDESNVLNNERPPEGYPISYIATRRSGFLAYPVQAMGYDIRWCPHYPHPQMRIFEEACQNCYQCLLCYDVKRHPRWNGYKGRPNVVYLHHSTKGRTVEPQDRVGYAKGHFRRLWLEGKRWDIQPGSLRGLDDDDEIVVMPCGILTSDGWYAPDDDA